MYTSCLFDYIGFHILEHDVAYPDVKIQLPIDAAPYPLSFSYVTAATSKLTWLFFITLITSILIFWCSSVLFFIGIWTIIKHWFAFNVAKLLLGTHCECILQIFQKSHSIVIKKQRMVLYYLNGHWRLYKKWPVFLLRLNQRTSCSVPNTDINIFSWTWTAFRRKRTGF